MRRFLSLFMVFLLALRGLAGDAMAMEQNANHARHMGHEQTQRHAQSLDRSAAMHHSLHHGHAAPMADGGPPGHHDRNSHQRSAAGATTACSADVNSDCHQHEGHCTACGICHSTLATPELQSPQASAPPGLMRVHGAVRFASAAHFELVKPPISEL